MKMKKLFVTTISVAFAMLMMVSNVNGQKKFVNKAMTWAQAGEKLDTALKAIEFAETQEKTKEWAKTYYVKGLVYNAIGSSKDPAFSKITETPFVDAFYSFKKSYNMEGSKSFQAAMDIQFLTLSNKFIQKAIDAYNEKDYVNSFDYFEKSLEVKQMPIFENEIDTAILYNTAIAAQRIEKYDDAIKYYQKLIKIGYGEGDTYSLYADCYKLKEDKETYIKTLKEGFGKYPGNQSLLGGIINYYLLDSENSEGALEYIKLAQQGDPTNAQLYSAEAHLYNKTGDFEKAKETYKKAIEMDSELVEAQYNLGVIYFNEGFDLSEKANMITDNAKYKVAKAEADEVFSKSLPLVEKAYELSPDDEIIMSTLKTIYYRLKGKDVEMNAKFDALEEKLAQ